VFNLTNMTAAADAALAPLAGPRNFEIAAGLRTVAAGITPQFVN